MVSGVQSSYKNHKPRHHRHRFTCRVVLVGTWGAGRGAENLLVPTLIFHLGSKAETQKSSSPCRGWLLAEVSAWISKRCETSEWPEANQFNELDLNFSS